MNIQIAYPGAWGAKPSSAELSAMRLSSPVRRTVRVQSRRPHQSQLVM